MQPNFVEFQSEMEYGEKDNCLTFINPPLKGVKVTMEGVEMQESIEKALEKIEESFLQNPPINKKYIDSKGVEWEAYWHPGFTGNLAKRFDVPHWRARALNGMGDFRLAWMLHNGDLIKSNAVGMEGSYTPQFEIGGNFELEGHNIVKVDLLEISLASPHPSQPHPASPTAQPSDVSHCSDGPSQSSSARTE